MTLLAERDLLGIFLVFCRIGTAVMVMPGFAVARAPVLFRVLLAIMLSASIYPMQRASIGFPAGADGLLLTMVNELMTGLWIGFLCALFLYATRFAAHFVMMLIGLAGIPGQVAEDAEPNPPFVLLLSTAFGALVFALDLHLASFQALTRSYALYPLGHAPLAETAVLTIGKVLADTSTMALQASSPFLLYVVAMNVTLGLIGKLTPQLQVYFAMMGLSTMLALVLLALLGSPLLGHIATTYASWLQDRL
jgi:flagellar biosynthesis protein FliR